LAARGSTPPVPACHLFVFGDCSIFSDCIAKSNALADRSKVGQRAPKPALINVELAARERRFLDRFLRLLLCTDEKNFSTATRPS